MTQDNADKPSQQHRSISSPTNASQNLHQAPQRLPDTRINFSFNNQSTNHETTLSRMHQSWNKLVTNPPISALTLTPMTWKAKFAPTSQASLAPHSWMFFLPLMSSVSRVRFEEVSLEAFGGNHESRCGAGGFLFGTGPMPPCQRRCRSVFGPY